MRLAKLLVTSALSLGLFSAAAYAQDAVPLFGDSTPEIINPTRSVNQLISRGKYKDALELADKELAANPQNMNLRFLRGVIFADTNRPEEAKTVFEQLTREYPEVAEPYNNLAVIYAGEGNLGYAQKLLERAIQNSAMNATTYQNLGDIYQAKALQMFEKSSRLNPKNATLKKKIKALKEIDE